MADDKVTALPKLSQDQIDLLKQQIAILEGASGALDGMRKMGLNTAEHDSVVSPLLALARNMLRVYNKE
jgi:hypothetical protein